MALCGLVLCRKNLFCSSSLPMPKTLVFSRSALSPCACYGACRRILGIAPRSGLQMSWPRDWEAVGRQSSLDWCRRSMPRATAQVPVESCQHRSEPMRNCRSCYRSAPACGGKGFKWACDRFAQTMAAEIFGTAAIFWVLIPIGLAGGALLLKLQGDD